MREQDENRKQDKMRTNGRYHEDYDHDDPREIERELQETRRRIDETVHTIERRLSPGELLDQGLRYMRRGPGQFGQNLARTIRDNPIPVMLVGIGLTWLAIAESAYAEMGVDFDKLIEEGKHRLEKERGESELEGRAKDVKHRVQGVASDVRERGREVAHSLKARGRETAHAVRSRGRAAMRRSRATARKAREGMAVQMRENPLLMAALGVAAGVIIGSMIPSGRRERQLFGDVAQKAKHKGQEVVHKMGDVAKEAAREGMRAAEDAAKRHMPSEADTTEEPERRFEGEAGGARESESGIVQEHHEEHDTSTSTTIHHSPRFPHR